MKVTSRGEYAIRAALYMADHYGDGAIQMNEISGRTRVPRKYLEQIFLALKGHGLVGTKRGNCGGYYLRRPPANITVGQILRIMDGPIAPMHCASVTAHEDCSLAYGCALRTLWVEIREAIVGITDRTSLADLCARQRRMLSTERPPKEPAAGEESGHEHKG